MQMMRGTTFINACMAGGEIGSVRILGTRIAALDERPAPSDAVVDLCGDRLLPGLINAHDHLQLNSLKHFEPARAYRHAREWIADVDARRRSDPEFEATVRCSRDERLLIGGMKNLLSGVTTVAHHDRYFPFLASEDYPISVVDRYGWSHSLYLDDEADVLGSFRRTPAEWPWIIHAAEGIDEEAAGEFERLAELGCLGTNTLIVHGVALDAGQRSRLRRAGAGLVWCPSSNLKLFGITAVTDDLIACGGVALGTDSRLSGARDLLSEMRIAADLGALEEEVLEPLATIRAAKLLRLADRGELKVGLRADILIFPAGSRLSNTTRAAVRLVVSAGAARYGDAHYAQAMSKDASFAEVRVDGQAKVLDARLAMLLAAASVKETGLELSNALWRAA